MKKTAKYKDMEAFLLEIRTRDDENRAGFEKQLQELIVTINSIDSSKEETYSYDVTVQDLTNKIDELIASIPVETILRWFPKA